MKTLNLIILVLFPIFFSCKNEHKEKEKHISQLVNEWQGKQILFPENAIFTRYLTDTTDYQIPQSDYKILVYIDSIGCTSCKLQLPKWKELIEYTDSMTQGKVPFLFFFHPKDNKEIRYLLKRDGFNLPVCIDREDLLNKLNKFPADITFQTFLLDKNNKVTVLGTFDKSETKETTIEVKNTGESPLVIVDVSTTCGCTAATYEKQPAKPEEYLRVLIKMTPKDTGFFDEVVTVRYNSMNNQPVKVKIKGNAK